MQGQVCCEHMAAAGAVGRRHCIPAAVAAAPDPCAHEAHRAPLLSNEAYSCAADTAVNAISQDKSRGHVLHLCLLTLCGCPIQLIAILQYTGGIQNTVEM